MHRKAENKRKRTKQGFAGIVDPQSNSEQTRSLGAHRKNWHTFYNLLHD